MVFIPDDIQPGLWLGEDHSLGMLANISGRQLVFAYTDSEGLGTLAVGGEGVFYQEHFKKNSFPVSIVHLSRVNSEFLNEPLLASVHKGPIAVEPPEQPGRYRSKESIFLVVLEVQQNSVSMTAIQRGYVRVASEPRSYALRMWRNLYSLLIRESGF